ncbi:hypothetical protein EDB81DRAFT_224183 [Dactylonectria macrodidyma]|uniref:Peptidase M14 domain-containing protein n=1 Tax=Dactylonectria macrodidyma TaxID=307937 RepID=A0A9P9DPF2_9HYPO|nr:hypothetical protein EDB81DRAFT_224183 [Dactylonectria macrodidyma]
MKIHAVLAAAAMATGASSCLLAHDILLTTNKVAFNSPRSDIGVGSSDRFANGSLAPFGLGIRDRDLETILNPGEVDSALRGLASISNKVNLFTSPFTTFGNASLTGASYGNNPRVFIMGGIHARERGGPDSVVYFMSDLVQASLARAGIRYGNKTYTHKQVLRALSAGVVILPLVNPDGVAHDQSTDSCWRKNRNPTSASGDSDNEFGVDLNRNFDFLWNYTQAFSPEAELWAVASDDPASDVFHGTSALSEPETQSVAWVLDSFPSLSWHIDLHSVGGAILYGWGDDTTQSSFTHQNFTNAAYDGKRGIITNEPEDSVYGEYMQASDLNAQLTLAKRMRTSMASAGHTPYLVEKSVSMYPTSGTSTDYALGRFYGRQCGASKVRGMTLEFGGMSTAAPCPFYPSSEQYHTWLREVGAGLMEVLLSAAEEETAEIWEC